MIQRDGCLHICAINRFIETLVTTSRAIAFSVIINKSAGFVKNSIVFVHCCCTTFRNLIENVFPRTLLTREFLLRETITHPYPHGVFTHIKKCGLTFLCKNKFSLAHSAFSSKAAVRRNHAGRQLGLQGFVWELAHKQRLGGISTGWNNRAAAFSVINARKGI